MTELYFNELGDTRRKVTQGPLMVSEYRCDDCGQIKEKVKSSQWTEEIAFTELDKTFSWPTLPEDDVAIICDDCFEAFNKWLTETTGGTLNASK